MHYLWFLAEAKEWSPHTLHWGNGFRKYAYFKESYGFGWGCKYPFAH